MTASAGRPRALDQFGFPTSWSIQTRREIRRVRRAFAAMPPTELARLAAGREAADAVAAGQFDAVASGTPGRLVLALPFPVDTGGMRVLVDFAHALVTSGTEVHIRQVRGDDCRDDRYEGLGFASRVPVGDPRHLASALRELAPATLLVGGWIDYFAALESSAGPVVGYSAGEAALYETAPFDRDLVEFAYQMHRLPVTLLAGSRYVQRIYEERFGRASCLVSVPIAVAMFGRGVQVPPRPPFRVLVIGPEHNSIKGIPGALEALAPLRDEGVRVVWVSPSPPSAGLAALVDETHVDLDADAVAQAIRASHTLVFPSRVEGLGNPPLEAMALGVPPVLCPNGGSQEYAIPEQNCVLVPYGDGAALRAAVRRLRDDPVLASRIRQAGASTAKAYQPERVHAAVRGFLRERQAALPYVPLPGPGG